MRIPRLALAILLAAFSILQIETCIEKGAWPLRQFDAQSEQNSSYGAERFVDDGFRVTSFLPRSGAPLNLDSGSLVIRNSDIYVHYFPGPDYVMAVTYSLFGPGESMFRWTRLVPLAHVLGSVLLLLVLLERRLWPGHEWTTAVMAALVLFAPAMITWSITLHGHAYSSSYIMLGLSLGLLGGDGRHRHWRLLGGFALGFLSNYMLLTAAFVVCAAPLAGSLLVPGRRNHGFALLLAGAVGAGLVAAFGLHYLQIVNQFGWLETRLDQFGVFTVRAGPGVSGTSAFELFTQYQAEVTRMFGLTPTVMLLIGLWAGAGYPGPARTRLTLASGVTVAFVSSWVWILLMRQHSAEHGHVNPRIFLLPYLCCLASAGMLASARGSSATVTT